MNTKLIVNIILIIVVISGLFLHFVSRKRYKLGIAITVVISILFVFVTNRIFIDIFLFIINLNFINTKHNWFMEDDLIKIIGFFYGAFLIPSSIVFYNEKLLLKGIKIIKEDIDTILNTFYQEINKKLDNEYKIYLSLFFCDTNIIRKFLKNDIAYKVKAVGCNNEKLSNIIIIKMNLC
jgi:hypothetical protein